MVTTSLSRTAKSESFCHTRLVPLPDTTVLNEEDLITTNYLRLQRAKWCELGLCLR